MGKATKAQYKKAARLYASGQCSQAQALFEAKIYPTIESAQSNGYRVFKNNEIVLAEMKRVDDIEFDKDVMSKKEKLAVSAALSRGIQERIEKQIEKEEEDLDHKLIDSFVKLVKRDDTLQGHNIMAETNPVDKLDAAISGWVLEIRQSNDGSIKQADAIDIDGE